MTPVQSIKMRYNYVTSTYVCKEISLSPHCEMTPLIAIPSVPLLSTPNLPHEHLQHQKRYSDEIP
jgi:hypothetical protein